MRIFFNFECVCYFNMKFTCARKSLGAVTHKPDIIIITKLNLM